MALKPAFETAVAFILIDSTTDTDAAVSLAVELYGSPAFVIPLIVGLIGFAVTLLILAFALWRSKIVPIIVPLLFVLPILVTFVPLPVGASSIVPSLLLVVPCLWISVQLIRRVPGEVRTLAPVTASVGR